MKDEIKEISDNIRKIIKSNREDNFNRVIYDCDSLEKLLDYITNLQEENQRLKKSITDIVQQNIDNSFEKDVYKTRIDKAIEYIEKGNKHFKENYNEPYEYTFMINADEIMKILQGEQNE